MALNKSQSVKSALLLRVGALAMITASVCTTAHAQSPVKTVEFNLPAQSLEDALKSYGVVTDKQMMFATDIVEGKKAKRLSGEMEPMQALDVLLSGSGLVYETTSSNVILVKTTEMDSSAWQEVPDDGSFRVAQADTQNERDVETDSGEDSEDKRDRLKRDEIIVTGTNIRGVSPDSSPSFVFDREAIERTGMSTTERFIETLPQNFSGLSEISFFAGGSSSNVGNPTGANLRGLGADSTLTLLDGHRLAPGSIGNAVDLSMIPLSIIERVEVITDGASAIYGSDAIGGVVNFTTRKDFDGAQTTLRGGTVTDGNHTEFIGSQAFGKSFSRGNILGVYEYQKRSRLSGADREFSETAPQPVDLLPKRARHSVFVNGNYEANENLKFNSHVFYSNRQVEQNLAVLTGTQFIEADVNQFTAAGGAAYDFSETWQLDIQGLFSRSKTDQQNAQDGVGLLATANKSTVASIDAKLDGTVFSLPGGDLKLAMGGHYRTEKYDFMVERFGATATAFSDQPERDVYAVFGEVYVPLVSEDNRMPGVERLEVNAAVRYEDYSDFGDTTNPKFGVLWSPIEGLNLRGTWGTSFKAPLLDELFNLDRNLSIPLPSFILAPSPDGTPAPVSVFLFGSNPNLKPEEATTWTAGFDFVPGNIDGLRFSVTYYDIEYTQRIVNPIPGSTSVFALESQFAPLIDRNPDPAALAEIAASPFYMNFFGIATSDIMAIVDSRLANFSNTHVNGVDFLVSSEFDLGRNQFGLEFGGSYIIKFENQLEGGPAPVDVVNTVFHPVGLNLRGGANWSSGPFSVSTFVSYVDGYEDNRPSSPAPIGSFTTVDLSLAYNLGETTDNELLRGTSLSLSISNLFDQEPPFVVGDFSNINYDGTNANPIGRFISLQVQKTW